MKIVEEGQHNEASQTENASPLPRNTEGEETGLSFLSPLSPKGQLTLDNGGASKTIGVQSTQLLQTELKKSTKQELMGKEHARRPDDFKQSENSPVSMTPQNPFKNVNTSKNKNKIKLYIDASGISLSPSDHQGLTQRMSRNSDLTEVCPSMLQNSVRKHTKTHYGGQIEHAELRIKEF